MKLNFKYAIMAFAALTLGFTSCNNDDEVDGNTDKGKPTFMELNVSFRTPGTYATADQNATTEEAAVKTVTVFIFDKTSNILVSKGSLSSTDFTQSASGQKDVYTATKKVETTTGLKLVYVGVNLPAALDLGLGATLAELKSGVATASATTLAHATNGFAMFSNEDKEADLVETSHADYATKNTVTVPVERLTVKVTVEAAAGLSLSTGGGVLSDLQFAVRQSNKKLFRYKYTDAGVVKDPNWDTYDAVDFEDFTDYANINAAGITDITTLIAKYANENTSKNHLEKETTYISIKANFVPNEFLNGAGASKGSNVGQSPVTFWVVSTNDGVKNYFNVETEADAYMALTDVADKSPVKSAEYTGGVCYYNMFLNPKGGYNAVRNSFFRATITQIIAPGNPGPGPQKPEEPIETPTDILVNFEILPWTLISDDYILK